MPRKEYYQKNRAKLRAYEKAYRQGPENQDRTREQARAYYYKNRERILRQTRERYAKKNADRQRATAISKAISKALRACEATMYYVQELDRLLTTKDNDE